jgi:hypothetical protein
VAAKEVSPLSRSWRTTVVFAVLALAAPVAGAGAQEPGVVYEPGSPSGKEYAIPLEEARRDNGGEIPGSRETRAFGIGLSRRGAAGRRAGAGDGGEEGPRGPDADTGSRAGGGGEESAESPGLRDRIAEAEGAGAPASWRLLPLLLVLVPGLLVGLLLARRGAGRPAAT